MTSTTLVVLAHPEPESFNGEWARESCQIYNDLGHRVLFSDLVSMNFDPVEKRAHYTRIIEPRDNNADVFDPLKFQERAASLGRLPEDVAREIDKIQAADQIIFHFPMWWFGPPAILKGWMDRCLAHGALHSTSKRFDSGKCVGKKALFCVTTGSTAEESSPSGKEGDSELLLWPLAYTLRYVGFTILHPNIVHGVHGYYQGEAVQALENKLQAILSKHQSLLKDLDERPSIQFNQDCEFDENGLLRSSARGYSPFIVPSD